MTAFGAERGTFDLWTLVKIHQIEENMCLIPLSRAGQVYVCRIFAWVGPKTASPGKTFDILMQTDYGLKLVVLRNE